MEWLSSEAVSLVLNWLIKTAIIVLLPMISSKVKKYVDTYEKDMEAKKAAAEAQGEKIQYYETKLDLAELIETLVMSAEQTLVKEYKKAQAPDSDGGAKVTDAEKKVIKQNVISEAKRILGKEKMDLLDKFMGDTGAYIEHLVEQNVFKVNNIGN